MVPSVFISSTVEDLRHVRDAVRATVEELGYLPVMSDYGEVGYMGDGSAESACYRSVNQCQLMVLIIGKRFGCPSGEDAAKAITEKEFDAAYNRGSRIITLIENDVLHYKKVFDFNSSEGEIKFPGMNDPFRTFAFISRICDSKSRNAVIPFTHASDIRQILKRQIASLFYDLLESRSTPTQSSLNDILSEVKTIRNAMSKKSEPDQKFQAAVRFLIDDDNAQLKQVLKDTLPGPVEKWIPIISSAENFDVLMGTVKVDIVNREWTELDEITREMPIRRGGGFCPMPFTMPLEDGSMPIARYAITDAPQLIVNNVALEYYRREYLKLKRLMDLSE